MYPIAPDYSVSGQYKLLNLAHKEGEDLIDDSRNDGLLFVRSHAYSLSGMMLLEISLIWLVLVVAVLGDAPHRHLVNNGGSSVLSQYIWPSEVERLVTKEKLSVGRQRSHD